MKALFKFLILLIFTLSSNAVQAQFLKKLKDKAVYAAERTVHRKAEEKTVQKTEEVIEEIFEKAEQTNQQQEESPEREDEQIEHNTQQTQDFLSSIMGGGTVNTDDSYSFFTTATILIEDHYGKEIESHTMVMSYDDGAVLTTVPENKDLYLIDFKNEAAIIIKENEKIAQTMSLSFLKKLNLKSNTNNASENDFETQKTGRTKTINGYYCEEYISTSKNEKAEVWVTTELDINQSDFTEHLSSLFGQKIGNYPTELKGYVMEATSYEDGKKISFYQVQEISKKTKTVKMSEYKVQDMFGQ